MASNERSNLRDRSIVQWDGKEHFTPVAFSLHRKEKQNMRVGTIHARSSGLLQQNPEVPSERATQHFGNYNAFKKEK